MMRNKSMHYRELALDLQLLLGPFPGGFVRYFTDKFPILMIVLFRYGVKYLKDEPRFKELYFNCKNSNSVIE
jgi:Ribonuclease 2-5A